MEYTKGTGSDGNFFLYVAASKATSMEFVSKVQTANVFKTADVVGLSNVVLNDAVTTF